MDIEKEISKRVLETGYSRLDVIASMNLGRRSEAAQKASKNRKRRNELLSEGMSFESACLVVNKENELTDTYQTIEQVLECNDVSDDQEEAEDIYYNN